MMYFGNEKLIIAHCSILFPAWAMPYAVDGHVILATCAIGKKKATRKASLMTGVPQTGPKTRDRHI
jgi:hypothetical protein